ncbi:Oligogalacturonate-specific porin protein KdgM [Shigella flexneri]|uniref:Oligogalacturonate-specific porin protein KdgM n=1 Tax=Shigella flexneri TaxID=623 RepID=A0A658Z5G9_SHIFL|nr:type IV pilin PilA domain protein [Shigella flexneri]CEP59720.1 Oligogalacturonate-specific porin protein KdgM [Shigella flexneri 2a]SRH58687.1 Oligogalacturonate-specific porin protein KdgM [Shigella flexneri 2b]CDX08572.1 Oligogalacturonate-specific porin protein KdgM [Shigella flexneri]SPZ75150.1 Oligogalacturonate-specific porin protein KdgM [Shigella flexneri]
MNKVTKTAIVGLLALFAGNAAATDGEIVFDGGNDSNLLIVFYVQIMPDDLVMQLHRF